MELRLTIHVKAVDQGYTSTFDSPDQNAFAVPCTTTTFKFPDFSFSLKYFLTEISGIKKGLNLPITFGRTSIAPAPNSPEALKQKYDKQEVYITMRDSVKLFTSIYTPKNNSVAHPVLLNRTPYNIEPGGPGNFNFFMQLYARYTEAEYIMVFQDVRGKYMSEGEYEDIRPVIPEKRATKILMNRQIPGIPWIGLLKI